MAQGVLNIDKPSGLTSHDVVDKVRWLSGIRRVGHAGTLDPIATGVLLLCVGRATRLAEYLTGQDKRYVASVRLGQETDTFDREGQILSDLPVTAAQKDISEALEHFRGEISQQAPRYSAIKVDGEPLYKRSRRGEHPGPPTRQVTIYELEILDWDSPNLTIDLTCSSGTYIRSIAHDLGQILGCGGHISELRRMAIGSFTQETSLSLKSLNHENWSEQLLPMDVAVNHLPHVTLTVEEATMLFHGQPVLSSMQWKEGDLLRIYDDESQFVGLATFGSGQYQAKKIFYNPKL